MTELDVVTVLRRCQACRQWKALEHYLLHDWLRRHEVIGDSKLCAGCRIRGVKP